MKGKRRRGFGMLEVLISAALLVGGLAAVTQFQANLLRTGVRERHLVTGTQVAEQTLERLLVAFADSPDLGGGAHTGPRFDDDGNPDPAGRFETSWNVVVGDPIVGARRVTVEVRWDDDGAARKVTLTTIRS